MAHDVERLAVIAFDNQSPESSANAVASAASALTVAELAGANDLFAYAAPSMAEAWHRRPTQSLQGYLVREPGSAAWMVRAQLRDTASGRVMRTLSARGANAGEVADSLVGAMGRKAAFAAAKLGPEELARWAQGPQQKREPAAKRAEAAPTDAEAANEAATAALYARDFAGAARFYKQALRADPEWPDLNNNAAFAFIFAGDLEGARAALARYERLAPLSGNPQDSLGEVLCMARRFEEAERAFLASYAKEPAMLGGVALRKAAAARRLAGPQQEADKLFARYAEAQKNNPTLPLEQAQWDYTSGRQKEAMQRLAAFAASSNRALAWSQLAAWRLAEGNAAEALRAAEAAWKTAASPLEKQSAALARFIAQPDADAAKWTQRAEQMFTGQGVDVFRKMAVSYALLVRKQFAAAVPFVKGLYATMHPATAEDWQAMLAVALAESGQMAEAQALVRTWPDPRTVGEATYDFVFYPAINKLRQ